MTDTSAAAFHQEGEPAFKSEGTEEDTSADSQSGDDNQEGNTQSDQGDNSGTDDDKPFHEHPRWKQREDEWTARFNDQEKRHADELKEAITSIRSEFGEARDRNAANTKIPAWFGGTQEQWDAYRADRDAELAQATDAAEKRAIEKLETKGKAEEKAVADATAYLHSEISAIEGDKTLNPSGTKVDAEALLKVVLDNQLIDTQGRWNYRAGFKLMKAQGPAPVVVASKEKKDAAAASMSESRGEKKESAVMTSADFKKDRPW